MSDMIHQPPHYTKGGIETIDFIRAKLSDEGYRGYLTGNVIKYITRYENKGGVDDLEKAGVYLRWLIDHCESIRHEERKAAGGEPD